MRVFAIFSIILVYVFAQDIQDGKQKPFQIEAEQSGLFLPTAEVKSNYYASFRISPIFSSFYSTNRKRNTTTSFDFDVNSGWIWGEKKDILFGFFVDGATAIRDKRALYSLGVGLSLGGRVWEGRVIPQVRLGYLLAHLPLNLSKQYNVQGGLAELNMFFDITQGYGIFVAYRHGFAMEVLKESAPRFNVSMVMVGFNFYDFNLSW